MTVLSTVQSAAPWLGIEVPDQVFSATTRAMVEMQAVVAEAARQIAEAHDWSKLKAIATITGDGSDTEFNLPSDYDRLTKTAELRSSVNTTVPLTHITDLNDWLNMEVTGIDFPYGAWIEYGEEIHIKPARSSGETVKYPYMKNTIVRPASGSDKAAFTADDDNFILSEALLKLAIIWIWKAQKNLDYQEDAISYQVALAKDIGRDKGPSIIAVGGNVPDPLSTGIAYPYPLGS